jgi:predicted DNA-binding transcriptional regulator YafY
MKEFYQSENDESSQKKIQRDINQILNLGFPVKIDSNYHYRIDTDAIKDPSKLFSREERIWISDFFKTIQNKSPEIQTLLFKLLKNDLDLLSQHSNISDQPDFPDDDVESNKIIHKLGTFIQNKIPCMFEYKAKLRTIEPYNLLKRNFSKHYLYAYERETRSYKFYLIEKIQNCKKINGEFTSKSPDHDIEISNPLSFPIKDKSSYSIHILDSAIDAFELFLKGIEFKREKGTFRFATSNPEYLFQFLWELDRALIQIEPEERKQEFIQYLDSIYQKSQEYSE